MRLLTNDEAFAVSGGHIDGQNDPLSLNGNSGNSALDACSRISSSRTRDRCYLETARRSNCPGGFTETTTTRSINRDGLTGGTTTVECKSSGSGSDGGGDDSSDGGSGNDGGNSD